MIKKNFALAENVAKVGYVPNQGISQAALTPQMQAGMRGIDSAASAFGLPNAGGNLGLPQPVTNQAGFSGYSPYAQYQQQISQIPQGQMDVINSFVIDPMTGLFGGQGLGDPYGPALGSEPPWLKDLLARLDAQAAAQAAAQNTLSGENFGGAGEDPGALGGFGETGALGGFGDALGSIGNTLGDIFSGLGFGDPGSPAGTPSAAGAAAASALGFGPGDFGGFSGISGSIGGPGFGDQGSPAGTPSAAGAAAASEAGFGPGDFGGF